MTDIQKHLPKILQTVRSRFQSTPYLSDPAERNIALLAPLKEDLARLLPSSYGIGPGAIFNAAGRTSLPIDLVIYDRSKTNGQMFDSVYPLQFVLVVIHFTEVDAENPAALASALETIQSIKALKKARPISTKPDIEPDLSSRLDRIPKQLLPLGIVFAHSSSIVSSTAEQLCLFLQRQLARYEQALRPDYLFLPACSVYYRNPAFDAHTRIAGESGLFREPDHDKFLSCYVCKERYFRRHFFYDWHCPRCGDLNYSKRLQSADLSGMIALVTGGRVKIGYVTALKLLRAGAAVIVTTRFPHDAARRYSQEADFATWSDRLYIYSLDLRHLPSIERFIQYLTTMYPRLDILINNAAQTVRHPPAFYAHLLPFESLPLAALPSELQSVIISEPATISSETTMSPVLLEMPEVAGNGIDGHTVAPVHTLIESPALSVRLSQVPVLPGDEQHDPHTFPPDRYDRHGQQIDARSHNSWVMKLEDIAIPELLEVQLINAIAPTILISQLKPLMARDRVRSGYIINVSAIEGRFAGVKLTYHPHTNMAKAALNMLTYTSAPDFARERIYMNSVDPGWISLQNPSTRPVSEEVVPLDEEDAAARICDPIFTGLTAGRNEYGKFFKDYVITNW
jgi:NAD(P)-dependent dehydrogenase (short-subunit alcohol dehydrogenase family)